jgi:hypothetical protein|eukprot:COSAG01_NODE_3899_length_5566_cov_76.125663_3_plen_105_part_00
MLRLFLSRNVEDGNGADSSCAPALVRVVLDERDEGMARVLWDGGAPAPAGDGDDASGGGGVRQREGGVAAKGRTVVAVVGMAHLQGIETAFERRAALAADSALE